MPTVLAGASWLTAVVSMVGTRFFGWHAEGVAVVAGLTSLFIVMASTRLYTTKLQDRIIVLEMKVRCAELLPGGDDAKLAKLTVAQVVGLRFASDEELAGLLDRTVREDLSPNEIKAAVKTWRPDPHRT